MRKPRSCSFETSKGNTLILKKSLYVWGTSTWEYILQQDKDLQVSPQTVSVWVHRARDSCPERLRRSAPLLQGGDD